MQHAVFCRHRWVSTTSESRKLDPCTERYTSKTPSPFVGGGAGKPDYGPLKTSPFTAYVIIQLQFNYKGILYWLDLYSCKSLAGGHYVIQMAATACFEFYTGGTNGLAGFRAVPQFLSFFGVGIRHGKMPGNIQRRFIWCECCCS